MFTFPSWQLFSLPSVWGKNLFHSSFWGNLTKNLFQSSFWRNLTSELLHQNYSRVTRVGFPASSLHTSEAALALDLFHGNIATFNINIWNTILNIYQKIIFRRIVSHIHAKIKSIIYWLFVPVWVMVNLKPSHTIS